jgi:methyl-accepting chemotaxis protein
MTLGELPTGGLYIDLGLGIVVFLLLLYEIAAQHRTRKRMAELEKNIVTLQHNQAEVFTNLEDKANAVTEMLYNQAEVFTNLEDKANAVTEMLFEKTKPLASKVNELSKRANTMLERSEALRQELEDRVGPLQAAIDESNAKFSSSHDAMRKVVQEGKSEIERMVKELGGFSEEIKEMKNFIRESTIDLEL